MNILPGMNAAFVDIGLGKNAYLFIDDLLTDKFLKDKNIKKRDAGNISNVLKVGDELLLQILREPMGEKNISVTADISLTGKYVALIPYSKKVNISKKIGDKSERGRLEQIGRQIITNGNGMIIRTFANGCLKEDIELEYNSLSNIFNKIELEYGYSYAPKLLYENNLLIEKLIYDYVDSSVNEIYVENKDTKDKIAKLLGVYPQLSNVKISEAENTFEKYNVEKQINMLFDRKVELTSGGSIFIDVTEAMTVIDVNSGSYTGNSNIEDTALNINIHALDEIKRQINLRNISGIIIIDFIDVKKQENKDLIISKAKSIFKNDKRINVLGMTKLNLMELTRKKDKENFFNIISKECPHCSGSGRTGSKSYVHLKLDSILKRIKNNTSSEAVVLKSGAIMYFTAMSEYTDIISELEEKYNIKIFLIKDDNIFTDEIIVDRTGKLNYINMYANSKNC